MTFPKKTNSKQTLTVSNYFKPPKCKLRRVNKNKKSKILLLTSLNNMPLWMLKTLAASGQELPT